MALFYSASTGGFYDDNILHKRKIPIDAVTITEDQHQVLLADQSAGKIIVADSKGEPRSKDRPAPAYDELAASARVKRDVLIAGTDYLVMPDYPISTDLLAKVKVYRQALRDITIQVGFPYDIDWPINTLDEVGV